MAKAPSFGQAKTRLVGPLSAEKVTSLYIAFVKDTTAKAQSLSISDLLISYTPADGEEEVKRLVSKAEGYFPQQGEDIGPRMASAFAKAFDLGYERVVLTGTDLPTLPASHLEESFRLLETVDLVLGPSTDGGYYLIGIKRFVPEIFQNVEWSTSQVLAQTLGIAKSARLSVGLLNSWYDVDTPEDLDRLVKDLEDMRAAQSKDLPSHTADELLGLLI